jgi:hypothetical protein
MTQQLFNPGPSSLRTARMLSYRVPKPTSTFAGPKPATHVGPIPKLAGGGLAGGIPDSPASPFTGPIVSTGAGRTDDVPMHVPSGAYVLPADVVSHIGEGNSLAGMKVAKLMFGPTPRGATTGPWGVPLGKGVMGKGAPMPKANLRPVRPLQAPAGATPTPAGPAPQDSGRLQKFGGHVEGSEPAVPIAASGGEFVISPAEVKRRGGGDINHGHKILDQYVKAVRADHIKTLKGLPGPAQ